MEATCRKQEAGSLGKYTLVEPLGESPLGCVYRAIDRDSDQPVAVRVLGDGIKWDTDVLTRFLRECQAAADLQHPGIATVYEVGQEGQVLLIATEFLQGSSLGDYIAQQSALSVEKKLSLMNQVAEGLSHAHTKGVLHCGLKPSKIHVAADGHARIRDFGIAHVLMRHLARPTVRWGSPIYLSPEQIQRQDSDERSDVFSAGVVFYELLTGVHPFRDQNSNKVVDKILFETHIPGIDRFPEAPPGIWSVLKMCMAKDPEDRYQSMADVAGAFRELLKELEEESQLMLAELQGSIPRLRKVTEQPGAAESTVRLLHDIQKLLSEGENYDYASLERLMGALAEQYSAIHAVASTAPALESTSPSFVPGPPETTEPDAADTTTPASASEDLPGDGELQGQSDVPSPFCGTPMPASPDSGDTVTAATPPADEAAQQTNALDPEAGLIEASVDHASPKRLEEAPAAADTEQPALAAKPEEITATPLHGGGQGLIPWTRPPRLDGQDAMYRRRIPRPTFRMAAALLSVLLIAVAAYILQGPGRSDLLHRVWSAYAPGPGLAAGLSAGPDLRPHPRGTSAVPGAEEERNQDRESTIRVLFAEAQSLGAQRRFEESRVLIRRILELDPAFEPAVTMLKQMGGQSRNSEDERQTDAALQKGVARVSTLMRSGNLISAITELETLQQIYPRAPQLAALRRRWEARNAEAARALARRDEERREAARLQREENRARQIAGLFAHGRYDEAKGALDLWTIESPSNQRARELRGQIERIQRGLAIYESAVAERRYQDALDALAVVEQTNPADPGLAEMRQRVESRKAAARASLTVHRLGEKGTLLLDGKPIGDNGEIQDASVPIGKHTLTVEDQQAARISRTEEFLDGQKLVYVYDVAAQLLRPLAEGDRERIAQMKAMEEVHRFEIEHSHGLFRGSCKGVLLFNKFDVEYRPYSGSHGFKIPFRRLNLRVDGRSIEFSYASDGSGFQSFKSLDPESAERVKQVWDRLRALGR